MVEQTQDQERNLEQDDQNEELQTPKFIDNRIDVKASTVVTLEYVIRSLSEIREEGEDGKKTKPFRFNILTNFGVVEGGVVRGGSNDEKSEDITEILHQSMDIRNDQLQQAVDELDGEPIVVNNTGAILVENVTITPFANPTRKIHMDHVYLFTDQIAGVTASL